MTRLLIALLVIGWGCEPARVVVFVPPVVDVQRTPDTSRAVQVILSAEITWMGRAFGRQKQYASGYVLANRGGWTYVVTCEHVTRFGVQPGMVATDDQLTVSGKPAHVWLLVVSRDLAVVRYASPTAVPLCTTAKAVLGQTAWACGWVAMGDDMPEYQLHTMRGYVAVTGRYIGHNAGLRAGFSGGPLLDSEGRVLGINRLMHGDSFGYAVPSRYLEAIIESLPP